MLIRDVCRSAGLTKKAVEYYIEHGIVQPSTAENGYRCFSIQDVETLKKAATLRKLGLSVANVREVLNGGSLKSLYVHMDAELNAMAERCALLKKLSLDGDYNAVGAAAAALERRQTISERLIAAFPGSYGRFLCLHFSCYLQEPMVTPKQRQAFDTIISFLDRIIFDIHPDDAELLEQTASVMDAEFVAKLHAGSEKAAADPEGYIEENRAALESYLAYKHSEEYKSSSAYKLEELLKRLYRESGYYDVFIPAMMDLSPSYRQHRDALTVADAVFQEKFGLV